MRKLDQNGIGTVVIVITLLVLSGAGFAGWRIYDQNNKKEEPVSQAQTVQEPKEVPAEVEKTTKAYTDEENHYSYEYPKAWKTSKDIYSSSLAVLSPDYASTNEGIGFHLTSGARMYVRVSETTATDPVKWFDARGGIVSRYAQERTKTQVDGSPAFSYKLQYEGSPTLTTVTIENGRVCEIVIEYNDGQALKKYQADYDALLESFKVLN